MTSIISKSALGLAVGAASLTAAVPAQAQHYRHHRHYRHHGGNEAGAAIIGGIIGLGIGAAIASSNDHRYDYDRRDYRRQRYYRRDGYYARRYYDDYRYCRVRRVWDPYLRRPVRVRYC